MRICIDLDGTICELRKPGETYADVKVKPGAKEMLERLHRDGHTIIISTARNMQTQGHNIGKVMKNIGKITLQWLDENNIVYDEIFFGKPNADITIDDRCIRFNNWSEISEDLLIDLAKKN
jgi:capsule biosynthesis phosphatase